MLRLNVNKSKFYALAKTFWPDISPMKQTEFTKAYRSRDYWLIFSTGRFPETTYHKVFLMTSCGKVVLCDDWCYCNDDGSNTTGWKTYTLDLETLRNFGLLEIVPEQKEA